MFRKLASLEEVVYHTKAQELLPDHVPHITGYSNGVLSMEALAGASTIAELWGEDECDVPTGIWNEIHRLVGILYEETIVYHDITSYNFMYNAETDRVYIIDFEHCSQDLDDSIEQFVYSKSRMWNVDFL